MGVMVDTGRRFCKVQVSQRMEEKVFVCKYCHFEGFAVVLGVQLSLLDTNCSLVSDPPLWPLSPLTANPPALLLALPPNTSLKGGAQHLCTLSTP
jgi:hypothetical protein